MKTIETLLSSIFLNKINCLNIANWDMDYGRFCSFFAIIWPQNPQLSIYWADIHRECEVKAQISYKVGFIQNIDIYPIYGPKSIIFGAYAQILLITQPIFSQFSANE